MLSKAPGEPQRITDSVVNQTREDIETLLSVYGIRDGSHVSAMRLTGGKNTTVLNGRLFAVVAFSQYHSLDFQGFSRLDVLKLAVKAFAGEQYFKWEQGDPYLIARGGL